MGALASTTEKRKGESTVPDETGVETERGVAPRMQEGGERDQAFGETSGGKEHTRTRGPTRPYPPSHSAKAIQFGKSASYETAPFGREKSGQERGGGGGERMYEVGTRDESIAQR